MVGPGPRGKPPGEPTRPLLACGEPIIGVSSGRRMVASSAGETRAHVLYTTYTGMIRRAGGLPVILTPGASEEAEAILGRIDGLLLG